MSYFWTAIINQQKTVRYMTITITITIVIIANYYYYVTIY